MGANDGAVLGSTRLVDNGPANSRFNIVLVSEGYRQDAGIDEMPLFYEQCRAFLRALFWAPPFSDLWPAINVHRLDIRSTQSGMDDPATCADGTNGSGTQVATYFDATMCGSGVRRSLKLDSGAVGRSVRDHVTPAAHAILVLVNSALFGGAAGDVAVFATFPGWEVVALHELGHMLGLGDEYECYVCNGMDDGRTWGGFLWSEPGYANITSHNRRSGLKWEHLVAQSTPCPTAPGSVPSGTVGLFEGAGYYAFSLFRPEQNCRMRSNPQPFCAVCREEIERQLAPFRLAMPSLILPTPVPASANVRAQVREKVLIATGIGGYRVSLDIQTNMPGKPSLKYQLNSAAKIDLPTPPTIPVPIRLTQPMPYTNTIKVEAAISVADLDYWVPGESQFTTAERDLTIELPKPLPSGNFISPQYDSLESKPTNDEVTLSVRPEIPELVAGNGFLYVSRRTFYSQIEMKLMLDSGYFRPTDDPTWALRDVIWTPTPAKTLVDSAVYEVNYGSGLCWLGSDRANSVYPETGFEIKVRGQDAIGQNFSATGWLRPANSAYQRSVSTIEIPSIPEWEWPMQFLTMIDDVTIVDGVEVSLEPDSLQIGTVQIAIG